MRTISVIVPCRNEIRHIRDFLESLLAQELDADLQCEFLIADGMSNDGTRNVLCEWQGRFAGLVVFDNKDQTVSSGLNAAICRAHGEIVIRMDVHAQYAPDYIGRCVAALDQTQADNVGGPALTRGFTYIQRAICLAYHSRFGCGGAHFHDPTYEGYVDTVTYGCWRKSTLESLSLFDEAFVRNQDDELNLRLLRRGGTIWQTPKIRSWYQPRSSLMALARQYFQYGYWKTQLLRKHRIPASLRHLVPGIFVAALMILGATAPFLTLSAYLFATAVAVYGLASITASLIACRTADTLLLLPVMPLVFAAYHLSYGVGFLSGLWHPAAGCRPPRMFTALSR